MYGEYPTIQPKTMSESCIRSGDEQAVNFLKNSIEIVGISVFLIYLNSHLQDVKRNVPLGEVQTSPKVTPGIKWTTRYNGH